MLDLPACIKLLLKHKNIVKNILFKLSLQSQYLHKHTFLCFLVICIPSQASFTRFYHIINTAPPPISLSAPADPGTHRLPSAV